MIFDLAVSEKFDLTDTNERIVIVGTGPVGIYLAYCLLKARQSVILIEAGARIADSSRNSIATRSVGREFVGHKLGRTFGLGGTSVVWGGQLAEFDRADFETWPLRFEDVYPLYAKVYADLTVAPESAETYRERLGGEVADDLPIERFFTHWLPQQNFARIFKKKVIEDPDTTVLLNSTVSGITFEGDRAKSVTICAASGHETTISGRHFVFCNGTLEIIRFFLSTAKTSAVPWRNNCEIGKRYQDHPCGKVATAHILDEEKFRDFFENAIVAGAVKLYPKVRVREEAREKGDLGVVGFFAFRSDIQEHLGHIKWLIRAIRSGAQGTSLRSLPGDIRTLISVFAPVTRRFVRDRRIMAFFDRSVDFMVQCEQRPSTDSQVRLNDEHHRVPGLFGIDIDWRLDEEETIHALTKFTALADNYFQARGLARLAIDERVSASDPAFVASMYDVYHHAGGMCMADSPTTGVVESDCRVWGTANVFIGGAAVFPSSGHANTTLTALALAARLAPMLAAKP